MQFCLGSTKCCNASRTRTGCINGYVKGPGFPGSPATGLRRWGGFSRAAKAASTLGLWPLRDTTQQPEAIDASNSLGCAETGLRVASAAHGDDWKRILRSGILEETVIDADFFRGERGAQLDAEAHISTQPPPPREDPRVQGAHEDQIRRGRAQPSPRRGPQESFSKREPSGLAIRALSPPAGSALRALPKCESGKATP